jgi:putative hydrolase of the HAD superfamily
LAALTGIKHLFFDLDDTLWDHEKNAAKALGKIFAELNLGVYLQVDFSEFFKIYREVNYELWSLYYKKQISKELMRGKRFNDVFKRFGFEDPELASQLGSAFSQRGPLGKILKENCLETLSYLQTRYDLHIISNGFSEHQHVKIDSCGLRPFFKHILISDEHQLIKPEIAFFRLAEKLAGADPSECVMIGDSIESDIAGAINAGWHCVHITAEEFSHPGITISKLSELRNYL